MAHIYVEIKLEHVLEFIEDADSDETSAIISALGASASLPELEETENYALLARLHREHTYFGADAMFELLREEASAHGFILPAN